MLGYNGAGKSTLLRIMAGVDTEYRGEAQLAPGATVGLLEQEPQLDESKDVRGNVEDGVRRGARRCSTASTSWPPTTPTRPRTSSRASRTGSTPPTPGTSTPMLEHGDGRAAAAARATPRSPSSPAASAAAWRSAGCCCAQPDLLLLDEPTNHLDAESVAWLERHLAEYAGTVVAVTHDRYFLDNVAGWILELDRGRGIPFKGNYSAWLEQKQARLAQEEAGRARASGRSPRSSSGCARTPRAGARSPRRASNRYEALLAEERNVKLDQVQIHIPAGPRLGDVVHRGRRACARASATGC